MKNKRENNNKKIIKKADVILLIIIIFICVIFLFFWYGNKNKGVQVLITVEGRIYNSFPINDNAEYNIVTPYGENKLKISNGQVSIIYADCKDKICQKHKPITNQNEQIICLPHKLVIEIERK